MASHTDSDWVIVGRFGRTHGIKGAITVHSFTEPRDNLLRYTQWHAYIAKQWQPIKILHLEVNDKAILVRVEGYSDREQVAQLTNVDIAIRSEELPELNPGEYYWHELIGLQVSDMQGHMLGNVTEIMPTGANDVLVIEGEKRHLIPYLLEQVVISVDLKQGLITVNWDVDF